MITFEEISTVDEHLEELSTLLTQVVENGASIGFLPPVDGLIMQSYWSSVVSPEIIIIVAKFEGRIVGSVQVHLCTKQNGGHRAEIAKLMTHPDYRRKGIGRLLMEAAEKRATSEGRTLFILDTREGDPSNLLYSSLGYVEAGRIPDYAMSLDSKLEATVIYYKKI
ncbi:GNAT family N-acetyltransferase [Pseudalkalibacillus sp. Hm43]|uniref:GNAT family N-acetyltransferase n=1 Tax=Pseudalkalibacillus sp. Hm43 TaxID=3450742 RepID=UPI003F424FFC